MRNGALEELAGYAQAQRSTGLLLIRDGRTILERNWPLPPGSEAFAALFARGHAADGALLEDVASQQKSVAGLIAAIAVDRGMLDPARPVGDYLGTGWSKASTAQEGAITVRHLLEMTSGLSETFAYAASAGTTFFYNTPVYARLHAVLEKAAGETLDAMTRDWLTGPLGMADTDWRRRPAELARQSGNAWSLVTTPRDVAKLGRMVMDDGVTPDGTRLISKAQFAATFAPTLANPAYGRLWWMNGSDWHRAIAGARMEGPLLPDAPADLKLALGANGRILGIVPSLGLIAVRLGQQPPDADFHARFWQHVMAAVG